MYRRLFVCSALALSLVFPSGAGAGFLDVFSSSRTIGFVPRTADNIGKELDTQLMAQLSEEGYARSSVCIACTVPVSVDNLKHTSPLARQMAEELARYLQSVGYRVEEIRTGKEVVMTRERGEFLLTRDVKKLMERKMCTDLVLTGTYTLTDRSMRFNIRLVHAPSSQVMAMSAGTVPMTEELMPLASDSQDNPPPLAPSVRTRLPR